MTFFMRLPCFSFIFALVSVGILAACAQPLRQLHSPERFYDVVQLGLPHDAQFVFCDGEDCPARSMKHLDVLPPSSVMTESMAPVSERIHPSVALSRAKVPEKSRSKRRKGPAIERQCQPIYKGKHAKK